MSFNILSRSLVHRVNGTLLLSLRCVSCASLPLFVVAILCACVGEIYILLCSVAPLFLLLRIMSSIVLVVALCLART